MRKKVGASEVQTASAAATPHGWMQHEEGMDRTHVTASSQQSRTLDGSAGVARIQHQILLALHHDTHLPTLICWQMIGFDNTLCVGNCTTFLKSRKLSVMMLYGYRLTVSISLRTVKLSTNVFKQNKCRRFLNKPTV